jgi:aspartokinase
MSLKDKYAFVGLGVTKQGKVQDEEYNRLVRQRQSLIDIGRKTGTIQTAKSQADLQDGQIANTVMQVCSSPPLVAIAIQSMGGKARSLLAYQVPIISEGAYKDGRITRIETKTSTIAQRRPDCDRGRVPGRGQG